jgi:hypothetical protein
MATGIPQTQFKLLWDDDFPTGHAGIRMYTDMSRVDTMDCMSFICPTYGAALSMKTKLFDKEPVVQVVWENAEPKRKRYTASMSSMIKALALCKRPVAAKLSSKLSQMSCITVSTCEIAAFAHASREDTKGDDEFQAPVEYVDTSQCTTTKFPMSHNTNQIMPFLDQSVVLALRTSHEIGYGDPSKTQEYMRGVNGIQMTTFNSLTSAVVAQAESCKSAQELKKKTDEKRELYEQEKMEMEKNEHIDQIKRRKIVESKRDKLRELEEKIRFFKEIGNTGKAKELSDVYYNM